MCQIYTNMLKEALSGTIYIGRGSLEVPPLVIILNLDVGRALARPVQSLPGVYLVYQEESSVNYVEPLIQNY